MFADRWSISDNKITSAYAKAEEEDVGIYVLFDPSPWAITADNKRIVRSLQSAGVIETTEKLGVKTETEGRKTIKYHEFSGALIHNFTFPEIPIEYEE